MFTWVLISVIMFAIIKQLHILVGKSDISREMPHLRYFYLSFTYIFFFAEAHLLCI